MTADVTVTPDIILKSYQLDIYYPLQEHMWVFIYRYIWIKFYFSKLFVKYV
jgi:hypothetical protein